MKKRVGFIGLCALIFILISCMALAADSKPKRTLQNNMTEVYHVLPGKAENLSEVFARGMVYGRLRTNLFYWEWNHDSNGQKDNRAFGVGGSLIYKTAYLHGIGVTFGLYTTQNPIDGFNVDKKDVGFVRTGKDTFERNKIKNSGTYDGHWGMTSLAQAYLEYKNNSFDIKLGRQIYESFLTKSNDTKMIPNTFEGLSVFNTSIPETTIRAAYFTRQKLRDHTDFHDVIAVDNWDENDDSVKYSGLTKDRLDAEDINTKLFILESTNKTIRNLKLDASFNNVPELFYSAMVEANLVIPLDNEWTITPGIRYMRQFDDGAGAIGGAALNGSLAGLSGSSKGYKDADNMDGGLLGMRAVLKKGAGSLHVGYTKVEDNADLIAPWRGFPTGGYTRSMAQYNWEANTISWMFMVFYNFAKAGIIPGFRAGVDYTIMNYDDDKERLGGHEKTDRSFIHIDMWKQLSFLPNLEAKIRIGLVDADDRSDGTDPSYHEWRFETNYLF